ncbi:MAG: Gfo/Idh/MocA family oxidoreductase [Clostridium sp.]|nr:Gfo/Idh/MocA family oxidoreductase [Clostridium sp.]
MKIGTIGTGMIVNEILEAVSQTEGIECGAVYSRREETGRVLADKFGVYRVYTDLAEMYRDEELDFIYIASPNSLHYEQAKRALICGKNVICEKPFTVTYREAKELSELAREKRLFLLEGITTMYLPNYELIGEKIGEIGKLKLVLCTFCQYSSRYDLLMAGETPNVFNPAFAGGALMDINIYNIYFAVGLFGKPEDVFYFPNRHENGVDTSGILIMKYPDFLCQCTGAKDTWSESSIDILGDKGRIHVASPSNSCAGFSVETKAGKAYYNVQEGKQWLIEIQKMTELVQRNDYEECYRRLDRTLEVMEVLEKARKR